MENIDKSPDTFESVRAILNEIALSNKASSAKSEQEMSDLRAWLAASSAKSEQEMSDFRASLAASSAKSEREMSEFRAAVAASRAESERRSADFDKQSAELMRQIKELKDTVNGISKSNGLFAEEYFFNSFEQGNRTFFGENFDTIKKNRKQTEAAGKIMDEYDIVFLNGASVGIVESKYRGRLDDIPKIIRKAETFRINYPAYRNHRIYLALASAIFNQLLEDKCNEAGIAIIKQVGDTVVINDKNLKVF